MKTTLKAYNTSLKIINYVEFLLIKRIHVKVPVFSFPISFPKEIKGKWLWVNKSYNWFLGLLLWVFQVLLKPVIFTIYGLISSIKRYYLIFTIIFLIYYFIIRCVLIDAFKNVEGFIFSEETGLTVLFLLFMIIVFFRKIPLHGKKENKLLGDITEKLLSYNFKENQWKLISENINIYKEYFDKRIVFINSVFAFGWASYLLSFKILYSNLTKESDNVFDIIKILSESFVYYLIVFAFIRSYTKIYRYIFELIRVSLNEVLFIQISKRSD